jgi:hypothetical protein
MARESFSVRWHVAHSNVRTSMPRSPGETRANPILCLQTGHIGRSTKEEALRITPTENDRHFRKFWSVRQPTLGKILAWAPERLEPLAKIRIGFPGHDGA